MPAFPSRHALTKLSTCLSGIPRTHDLPNTSTLLKLVRASSSSTRWKSRASSDQFSREAKVQGLKSRAAFKLLEINQKHRLFKSGFTVVDLGYAPGSWSQVAIDRCQPGGRVVGIDLIPAQPPRGVSTIQGNFLSEEIQREVREYVQDRARGRARGHVSLSSGSVPASELASAEEVEESGTDEVVEHGEIHGLEITPEELSTLETSYIDLERSASPPSSSNPTPNAPLETASDKKKDLASSQRARDEQAGRVVDVVLSDMSAPWPQTTSFRQNSISDIYRRMMNTSGNAFRDHVKSMDLCMAALTFAYDTLKTGGHFVCKYYQGAEDKELEGRLKKLFEKVHREKPEASRKESKEGFFIGLRRKEAPEREDILA